MKNIIVEFFDLNEHFIIQIDSQTTPISIAQLIQEANYYNNFNLSEIFYFQIKQTQYYFGNRNTKILYHLSNFQTPILVFHRGLISQTSFEKGKKVEDLMVSQRPHGVEQKKFNWDQNANRNAATLIGGKNINNIILKEMEQSLGEQNDIQTQLLKYQNIESNQQGSRQLEDGLQYKSSIIQNKNDQQDIRLFQKVYEKHTSSSINQTRTLKQSQAMINDIEYQAKHSIQESRLNQQNYMNNQLIRTNFQKENYTLTLKANKLQIQDLKKFLDDNQIEFLITST